MSGTSTNGERHLYIGFRASIITVFVAAVLFVGLILVYLSFDRISSITRTAASTFIEKVAQLGRRPHRCTVQERSRQSRHSRRAPPVQSAEIDDNPRLYALMASMLRNNPQLFSLYVGY
jgi:adenylate cyclase